MNEPFARKNEVLVIFCRRVFYSRSIRFRLGELRMQKGLHKALIGQSGGEGLVFIVAGVIADDMHRVDGVDDE